MRAIARPRRSLFGDEGRLTPYLYLLPHAILFFMFVIYPIFKGFWVSLTEWNMFFNEGTFVGLANYARLFNPESIQNAYYWQALKATLLFVVISVPPLVLISLGLAVLVTGNLPWRSFFRTIYFMPTALTISVVAVMWRWIFQGDVGFANWILRTLGSDAIPWLTTQPYAWISILIATVWWTVGWNMILLVSGLNAIPHEQYEAATIDGANSWKSFLYITLPNLRPILLFIVITTVIASFNLFGQPQLMTGGGPSRSTFTVMFYIYGEAFGNFRMGSSAAMSYVTAVIMLVATLTQARLFSAKDQDS
ncbi:MAG: sugar ABC transporter permease [Firmicutes bacterium]|nr:sugar ABC transporter permease [Bacillota bacterium]